MTSFFHGLASIVSLLVPLVFGLASGTAGAQVFPSKPITILVGFAAGGPSDTMARIVGQQLSASLGQPVLVDNRPGAGGKIAMQALLKAPRDGHTIAYISTSMMSISPPFGQPSFSGNNQNAGHAPVAPYNLARISRRPSEKPTLPFV